LGDEAEENSGGGLGEAGASSIGAAAALLAASVLLSRVIGYAREVTLAHQVGVGPETDAFYMAFLIPDVLNYMLAGGALAIAFIPLYNRVRRRDGDEAGEQLLATVLGTLGFITLSATVVLWIGADALIEWALPEFSPEARTLTIRLTRIVLPAQIFFLTGGLLRAVLMAHGRFTSQALAPILYNGATIAGGLLTGSAEGFAWGVLVGAFLGNWLIPMIEITRVQAIRVRVAPLDPHFRAYLQLALPLMVGVSLVTVDEWYEKFFGAQLAMGTVAQLGFARKLMMAPVAVVGQAVAAAALPLLSRLYAERDESELNRVLENTVTASIGMAFIAAGAVYVFSQPLVEVVYQYGRFTPEAAERVAALLAIMSLAVPGWVAQQVGVRAFYAREEMWRPMLLGSGIALLAIPLYLAFAEAMDAEGLAWAGVVAITFNALSTLGWSRRRFGGPSLSGVGVAALRSAAVMLASLLSARWVVTTWADEISALVTLMLGGFAYGVATLAAGVVLRDPVVGELILPRLRGRRGRENQD